jgi:nucleoside-diphosphate-sugar epimerase
MTGGSGNLDRSVVRRLSDEEHEVLKVDSAGEQSRSLVLVDLADCRLSAIPHRNGVLWS